MQVELSRKAQERIEEFVRAGSFPSAEAALEAAVEQLGCPVCAGDEIDDDDLDAEADADIAAGRVQPLDDAYVARLHKYVKGQTRSLSG